MMTTLRNQRDDKVSYTFHNTLGKTRVFGLFLAVDDGSSAFAADDNVVDDDEDGE